MGNEPTKQRHITIETKKDLNTRAALSDNEIRTPKSNLKSSRMDKISSVSPRNLNNSQLIKHDLSDSNIRNPLDKRGVTFATEPAESETSHETHIVINDALLFVSELIKLCSMKEGNLSLCSETGMQVNISEISNMREVSTATKQNLQSLFFREMKAQKQMDFLHVAPIDSVSAEKAQEKQLITVTSPTNFTSPTAVTSPKVVTSNLTHENVPMTTSTQYEGNPNRFTLYQPPTEQVQVHDLYSNNYEEDNAKIPPNNVNESESIGRSSGSRYENEENLGTSGRRSHSSEKDNRNLMKGSRIYNKMLEMSSQNKPNQDASKNKGRETPTMYKQHRDDSNEPYFRGGEEPQGYEKNEQYSDNENQTRNFNNVKAYDDSRARKQPAQEDYYSNKQYNENTQPQSASNRQDLRYRQQTNDQHENVHKSPSYTELPHSSRTNQGSDRHYEKTNESFREASSLNTTQRHDHSDINSRDISPLSSSRRPIQPAKQVGATVKQFVVSQPNQLPNKRVGHAALNNAAALAAKKPNMRYNAKSPNAKPVATNVTSKGPAKPTTNRAVTPTRGVKPAENTGPKVINYKLGAGKNKLNDSTLSSNSVARSTSPISNSRLNAMPTSSRSNLHNTSSSNIRATPVQKKVTSRSPNPQSSERQGYNNSINQLRSNLNANKPNYSDFDAGQVHAFDPSYLQTNSSNYQMGSAKPISSTPKGTSSTYRPFQFTAKTDGFQHSQRANPNNAVEPQHQHEKVSEDYYGGGRTTGRTTGRNEHHIDNHHYERERSSEGRSTAGGDSKQGAQNSNIQLQQHQPPQRYQQARLNNELHQQESPQFMKQGQNNGQFYMEGSDYDDEDEDDFEPIKVKLDLSAFTKPGKKPQDQDPSYDNQRLPSFQPYTPQDNQRDLFDSSSARRATTSNDFESEEEDARQYRSATSFNKQPEQTPQRSAAPRVQEGNFINAQGRNAQESFQPDQFRKALSREKGYDDEEQNHRAHSQRNYEIQVQSGLDRRNSELDDETNILRKVQQDIAQLSSRMNESLSPSYSKEKLEGSYKQPEVKGTQLDFSEEGDERSFHKNSTQPTSSENSLYKSQAMKGLTDKIKKGKGDNIKNDYYSDQPSYEEPYYEEQKSKNGGMSKRAAPVQERYAIPVQSKPVGRKY